MSGTTTEGDTVAIFPERVPAKFIAKHFTLGLVELALLNSWIPPVVPSRWKLTVPATATTEPALMVTLRILRTMSPLPG
jgi:hypothetical protein